MRVAVTGATGVIGRFIAENLIGHGHDVIALSKPSSDRTGFSQTPHWVTGELQDEKSLDDLLGHAEALVHCAFDHLPGRYRGGEGDNPAKFWQTNLLGTVSLLEAAHRHGLARVVLLSSRAVFGRRQAGVDKFVTPIDDDHPLWPDTHYGALKTAVEALAGVYSAEGMSCATLRPTGVYGLGYPIEASKWFDLARLAWQDAPTPTERVAGEVHGADVAQACQLLLHAPENMVSGRSFNCSDVVVSKRELYRCMRQFVRDGKLPMDALGVESAQASVENLMRCDGLLGLGWKPGGVGQLQETVAALVAAADQQS